MIRRSLLRFGEYNKFATLHAITRISKLHDKRECRKNDRHHGSHVVTVGTPYNTNVGVQKIPDRAIWKPMVAKRNNTNPWSWLRPQILVTQDSGQPHMSKQPASRDWPEQIAPLVHSSQTAWQLFNLGQSIEIRIPHLLGHIGQLHTKCISHIWLCFSVL